MQSYCSLQHLKDYLFSGWTQSSVSSCGWHVTVLLGKGQIYPKSFVDSWLIQHAKFIPRTDLLRQLHVLPHWERCVANQTCYLTQSQYTDTRQTGLGADPRHLSRWAFEYQFWSHWWLNQGEWAWIPHSPDGHDTLLLSHQGASPKIQRETSIGAKYDRNIPPGNSNGELVWKCILDWEFDCPQRQLYRTVFLNFSITSICTKCRKWLLYLRIHV